MNNTLVYIIEKNNIGVLKKIIERFYLATTITFNLKKNRISARKPEYRQQVMTERKMNNN
jgi:hypothetical protein